MSDRREGPLRMTEPEVAAAGLVKYGKYIIFGLLILAELLVMANNYDDRYIAGVVGWHVLLPVMLFFTAENALKLWGVRTFPGKFVFYVLDLMCLVILTLFSDGILISTMYAIVLTEFYLGQQRLTASFGMMCVAIVFVLATTQFANYIHEQPSLGIIALVSSMFNDLLLIVFHFFAVNLVLQTVRRYREIAAANAELEASSAALIKANAELKEVTALRERQRIAKDIHDTAGHSITTVIMQTESAKLVIDRDPADAKRKIVSANLQAKHALEELRQSVHLLSGTREGQTLQDELTEIVHDTTDGTGIVVRSEIDDVTLCDAKRRFLCNSLKEGISNGLRHGGATAFYFELRRDGQRVNFLLSDNGKGLVLSELKEGFGLKGMQERANALGGSLWFETEPEEGFEIHLTLPLDGEKGEV